MPTASFSTRLREAVRDAGSALCVGLDPDRMPAGVSQDARGVVTFCNAITDSTAEVAAAFKPNLAFFEALGPDGWGALADVCGHARQTGRLLVLDGKRGDIGHTGRLYARALFADPPGGLAGDAATVAPYMGADSLAPFLDGPLGAGRCAFALVATSNPGADDVQTLRVETGGGGEPLYRHVARMAVRAAEGTPGETGFVVGATRPERLAELRAAHPDVPFLVPGVGAQGGSAAGVMAANAGGPVLVNVGRAIFGASSGRDFATAAGRAAQAIAADLRAGS